MSTTKQLVANFIMITVCTHICIPELRASNPIESTAIYSYMKTDGKQIGTIRIHSTPNSTMTKTTTNFDLKSSQLFMDIVIKSDETLYHREGKLVKFILKNYSKLPVTGEKNFEFNGEFDKEKLYLSRKDLLTGELIKKEIDASTFDSIGDFNYHMTLRRPILKRGEQKELKSLNLKSLTVTKILLMGGITKTINHNGVNTTVHQLMLRSQDKEITFWINNDGLVILTEGQRFKSALKEFHATKKN